MPREPDAMQCESSLIFHLRKGQNSEVVPPEVPRQGRQSQGHPSASVTPQHPPPVSTGEGHGEAPSMGAGHSGREVRHSLKYFKCKVSPSIR